MAEEYSRDQLVILAYHDNSSDVFGTQETRARIDYYFALPGSWGFPTTFFDGGVDYHVGGGTPYPIYQQKVEEHLDIPSPLTLTAFGSINETEGFVTVTVTLEEDIESSDVKIMFVLAELSEYGDGAEHPFVVRDILPYEELTIYQAGEVATAERNFSVDADWDYDELYMVVFVQWDNYSNSYPVYQAVQMSEAGCTFEGIVTDAESGSPIPAHVWSDGTGFQTFAGEDGYYNLATAPGEHIIKCEYFGYYEHTSPPMEIELQEIIEYDIVLEPLPTVSLQGTITDFDDNPIAGATVSLLDVPVDPVYSDENGEYIFEIPGDYGYTMQVDAEGYDSVTEEVNVPSEGCTQDFTLFQCLWFEDDDGGFTHQVDQGPGFGDDWEWGTPVESGGPTETYDGTKAWGTDLDGPYVSGAQRSLFSGEYYIQGMEDGTAYLKFYYWMEAYKVGSTYWDGGNVQISVEGGEWTIIDPEGGYPATNIIGLQGKRGFGGETDGWVATYFDLTDYIGQNVQFRFQFGSTNNTNKRGWFIDHFVVYGANLYEVGITDNHIDNIPAYFSLSQNYPNPFNPKTTIHYSVPTATNVNLSIYDINGKLIKTLVSEEKPVGYYSATWNGLDNCGKPVGSGVYLYKINAGDYTQTKRCLLIK